MLPDPIGIPSCFSSSNDWVIDDPDSNPITRHGQTMIMSIYRTKLANQCRLITITWCRNPLLLHGLSVSFSTGYTCKLEFKPWYFWRKTGSKRFKFDPDGKVVELFWDLRSAKFENGETEPSSDYYLAVVYDKQVILLVGDLKNEAYKKTGFKPGLIDPVLVSKKEHIFGKKQFCTKVKFHEKGKYHDIFIECKCNGKNGSGHENRSDLEMEIYVDGQLMVDVKNLQWKFRGNECIQINRLKVEVYWDVHDWLFNPGLRHARFIFKPIIQPGSSGSSLSSLLSLSPSHGSTPTSSRAGSSDSLSDEFNRNGSSHFSLFLYAWTVE